MAKQAQRVAEGEHVNYTAGGAIAAGDVIVQKDLVGVAQSPMAAQETKGIDVEGIYDFAKAGGTGVTFAIGDDVWWDDTNNVAVATSGTPTGTNAYLGKCTKTAANADTTVRVRMGEGTGRGFKSVSGQSTTVAASDTIVTGLAKLLGVVATFDDDPVLDPGLVSASIGNQAGAPAAGSFLLKTWKFTSNANPTPIAATVFGKKVNWIAFGY
jgi:predicted RecA/RadA family phage recombinase